MNVKTFAPHTGRFIKENGDVVNIADLIGGRAVGQHENIEKYTPHTGRFIKENGDVVNIADAIEEFVNGGSGGTAEVERKEMTETTVELQPNIWYKWEEVAELNLTFAEEKQGVLNIFAFSFTSGATATRVTLPETIKIGDFVTEPNMQYEVTIQDNKLLYTSWEV